MIHPTPPPLSGDTSIEDDDDIIILTEEISPSQPTDLSDIFQLTDKFEQLEVPKSSEKPKDEPAFIDLTDAIEPTDLPIELPPDFSITEDDILNLDIDDNRFAESILPELEPSPESVAIPIPQTSSSDMAYPLDASEAAQPETFLDIENVSPIAVENGFSDLQELLSEPIDPMLPSVDADIPSISAPEPPPDELQRLINEVVHDSQVPPEDFSGVSAPIEIPDETPLISATAPVVPDAVPVASAQPSTAPSAPFSLPQEQIDAAVERVIRNLFDEKIEPMVNDMLIAAVNREIDHLKTVFLEWLTSGKAIRQDTDRDV